MLNIEQLEHRWFIYKFKSLRIYIIIFFIFITIPYTFMYQNQTKNIDIKKDINTTKKIQKPKTIEKKLLLKPSYNFMKNIETLKKENIVTQKKHLKKINIKNKIHIEKQNTKNDIDIVIKRFQTNKNPTLSLFIAKKYYKQENYKQSYKYAFITNELDNNLEESWIIFIKSMIKLNRKDKAIETLKYYIQHSNSKKARKLLDDIYSKKFR